MMGYDVKFYRTKACSQHKGTKQTYLNPLPRIAQSHVHPRINCQVFSIKTNIVTSFVYISNHHKLS